MNILIIGCGNIGALYDLNTDSILTHAKAFSKYNESKLFFFDLDKELAKSIAEKYSSEYLLVLNDLDFYKFDCICICTPTETHFEFLLKAMNANVKLIICEKPISNSESDLQDLKIIYNKYKTRILVNYIRRFQPEYIRLKNYTQEILADEKLTNISVRYQRGFINNCSHALDIISFITSRKFELKNVQKQNLVYDHFETDPTLSIMAQWNMANLSILGLSDVLFSHFEIDLYFETKKVAIRQAGNVIEIYQSNVGGRNLNSLSLSEQLSKYNCLNNYMENVILKALEMLKDESIEDNFLESLELNLSMLKILN